jgi:cell division protein FtsQ
LLVNLNTVLQRLLANPWIAHAAVERQLPDAIHIQIKERAPMAILDLNLRYYLDEGGEIFKQVEASDEIKVPVVTGLAFSDIDLNNPRRPGLFRGVIEVLGLSRLDGTVLPMHDIHRIHVDHEMGLTLFAFERGLAINLGFGHYESKYNRLRDMITHLRPQNKLSNVEYIDLNDLDRIVVRPYSGVSLRGVVYGKEI